MNGEARYTLGLDYGTLSARAALVDVSDGTERATRSAPYPHGVMERALPDGTPLARDWALQHPADYLQVLEQIVPPLLREAGIAPGQVIGIGIDFTASTVLPVKADGTPLCLLEAYRGHPHAYCKLWKHHAAQPQARRMEAIARERKEPFLDDYGGRISSEWLLPKLWQVLEEAPELYGAMDAFVEAADWLAYQLTGVLARNSCCAGYKACYNKRRGYPSKAYFRALDPRLETVVEDKLAGPVVPSGSRVGGLTAGMAQRLGLREGIPVAAPIVDAHVGVIAAGVDRPGILLGILGTSACFMLLSEKEIQVKGICGVVEDGIVPGYLGYEAGLTGMGDVYAWVADRVAGPRECEAARAEGLSLHAYLTRQAAAQRPGQHGLLALDWLNGNRSVLVDAELSGLLLGLTLQTTAADIYRAMLEATAFATRMILESFRESGIDIDALWVTGGISRKNPLAMQILSDVLDMPVRVVDAEEGGALGSAIFAAAAAGAYPSLQAAMRAMGRTRGETVRPLPAHVPAYDALYAEYVQLHDYFGRGGNDVMKRLLARKGQA